MAISQETKIRLLFTTKEAARAFVEDIADIREIAQRSVSRGELRRLSNVLRRLLIDGGGDLSSIAPPRTGRVKILGPDNNPIYRTASKHPFDFFGSGYSGGPPHLGPSIRACSLRKGTHPPFPDYDAMRFVELGHDGFLSQNVLCLQGEWVSRRAVIKYVANIACGVHSGTPQESTDLLLSSIRSCSAYEINGPNVRVTLDFKAIMLNIAEIRYNDQRLDPVLVEIIAACHYLFLSPSIQLLEDHIRQELGLPIASAHLSIR
jgi:hypothetical protein